MKPCSGKNASLLIPISISMLIACSSHEHAAVISEDVQTNLPSTTNSFYDPSQVTAGNESNFAPDLSANGEFLVYTSDRSGNKDIWTKPVTGGFARQITRHSADDYSPVISPNGKRIAFVSRRADAAGDIHIMDVSASFFNSGESNVDNVSLKATEDMHPAWYPDSQRLVFAARLPGELVPTLMTVQADSLEAKPLSTNISIDTHGEQPTVSPDGKQIAFIRQGAIYIYHQETDKLEQITAGGILQDGQPHFSDDGKSLVFARYADDSNRDGKLNGDDRASIWRLDLPSTDTKSNPSAHKSETKHRERENYHITPLTASSFSAFYPQIRGSYLYVTLQTAEGLDIFRLPALGQIQAAQDLQQMQQQFDANTDPERKTYILRRAQAGFATLEQWDWTAEAALLELDWMVQNRRRTEAQWVQAKIEGNLAHLPGVSALARLSMLELELSPWLYPDFQQDLSPAQTKKLADLLQQTDKLASQADAGGERSSRIAGRAQFLKAKIMASQRQFFAANEVLSKLVKDFTANQILCAQAEFYAARITPAMSDVPTAVRALRDVVRKYPQDRGIVRSAAQTAVRFLEEQNPSTTEEAEGHSTRGPNALVESLVALRSEAKGLPAMPALAHMHISEHFMRVGKEAVAANELRQIVDIYPESPSISLDAAEKLSLLEEKSGRFDAAEKMLNSLKVRLQGERIEHRTRVKSLLVNLLLRHGESLLRDNEPGMAIKEYRKAIALEPLHISGHRGLIDASFHRKTLAELRDAYEEKMQAHPNSAEYMYFYAYALTYKVDEAKSPRAKLSAIDDSIAILESARQINGQILQIHQTLGWLYLQKAYFQKRYYDSGSVLAGLSKRSAMVSTFFGHGDPNWLELGIDSFQTAYFLSAPDSLEQAGLAQNLGQTYYELKNYKKALNYYTQRLRLLATIRVRDPRTEGVLWRRAGRAAFQIEEMELAEELQRRALSVWEATNDDYEVAQSLDALALTLRERGKAKEALALYERLLRINERLGVAQNKIGTLTNLGYSAFIDGQSELALTWLKRAETAIQELEKKPADTTAESNQETDPNKALAESSNDGEESKAFKVDLGGQASAAKGFDLFGRKSLILSFKTKIYELLARPDLQITTLGEKLSLLKTHREELIDKGAKDQAMAEEIAIVLNNLGAIHLAVGHHIESRAAFLEAENFARYLRPDKQAYVSMSEATNLVNRTRVELRLATLGLLDSQEISRTTENLDKNAMNLRTVVAEGAKAESRPLAQILALKTSLTPTQDGQALEESLNLMGRSQLSENKRQGVLFAAKANPGLSLSDTSAKKTLESMEITAARDPAIEWKLLAAAKEWEKAFEALDRYIFAGGTLKAPTDRQAARSIFESAMFQVAGDEARQISLFRRYQLMQNADLLLRAFGTPVKNTEVKAEASAEGKTNLKSEAKNDIAKPIIPKLELPSRFLKLVTLKENDKLIQALDPGDSILALHLTMPNPSAADAPLSLWAAVLNKDGTHLVTGHIPSSKRRDLSAYADFIQQSPLAHQLPNKGSRLYFVPSGELSELPWEELNFKGEAWGQRNQLAFLPSMDAFADYTDLRKLAKANLGHLSVLQLPPQADDHAVSGSAANSVPPPMPSLVYGEASAEALRTANGQRDYELIRPTPPWKSLGENLAAYNLLHIDAPLFLNDTEPDRSVVVSSAHTGPIDFRTDITMQTLGNTDLRNTSAIIFANTYRENLEFMNTSEGHDGWRLLSLASAAAGVPSLVILPAAKNSDPAAPKPESDRFASLPKPASADWQKFYSLLTDHSIAEAAQKSQLPVRILGYAGIPSAAELDFAKLQVASVTEQAEDAYDEQDFTSAAGFYQQLYYLQTRLHATEAADQALDTLVKTLYQKRDYVRALHYKMKMLPSRRPPASEAEKTEKNKDNDPVDYADALIDAAVLAVRGLQFQEAERLLGEAELIAAKEDETGQLGKIYQYRGINLENQKRYEDTITAYEKSRSYYEDVDRPQAIERLVNIGNIYRNNLSQYPRAIEYYDQAVAEYQTLKKAEAYLPIQIDKANTLVAMGELEQVISLLEKDVVPALDVEKQRVLWVRATQALANAYYLAGMFQPAQELNTQTLIEIEKISDVVGKANRKIDAMSLKAMILAKLGQYTESFTLFHAALDLADEYKLKDKTALIYNNYGFWMREYGRVDQSIEFFNLALAIDQELKSSSSIAYDQRNLGLSSILKGDFNQARDLLRRALKTSEALRLPYNAAYCHFGLADMALREQEWQKAERGFKQALSIAEKSYMRDFIWRAQAGIATAAMAQGHKEEAEKWLSLSVKLIEDLRAGLKSEDSRNRFQSDAGVQEVYAAYSVVLMELGKSEAAWINSERARARAFIDSMGTQKLRLARSTSMQLLAEEKSLKTNIETLERRLNQESEKNDLQTQLVSARQAHLDLLKKMHQSDAQLSQFVSIDAISKEELAALLPSDTALVQYMVAKKKLFIWVVRQGQVTSKSVTIDETELQTKVRNYRTLMQNYSTPDYLGRELSDILLEPVREQLQGAKRLSIVPHRMLHFLSFASLPWDKAYLLDSHAIYYLESATLARFTHTHTHSDSLDHRINSQSRLLALAQPEVAKGDLKQDLLDLPFTRREVEVLPRYFTHVDTRLGAAATEAAVRSGGTQNDILHIATHGSFKPLAPADSSLQLSAESKDDGQLAVHEIFALPLQTKLVTLSACESGLGKISPADEVIGMNRAFFYAGADTVVSSLWRISDVASAVTMKRFYRNMTQGMDKAEAMRQAQLLVRRYYNHPAYWSSFRVLGGYQ